MGERRYGKMTSNMGFEYEGTFKNGIFDGLGKLTLSDGQFYDG